MIISNGPLCIIFSYSILKDLSQWMRICCRWKTQIIIALELKKFLNNADVINKSHRMTYNLSIFITRYCTKIQYIDFHKVKHDSNTFNELTCLIKLVKYLPRLKSISLPHIYNGIDNINTIPDLIVTLPPTLKCLSFLTEVNSKTILQIGQHLGSSLEELQMPLEQQMYNDQRQTFGEIIDHMLLSLCNLKKLSFTYRHDNKPHFKHNIHCLNVDVDMLEYSNWNSILSPNLTHLNLGFNWISLEDIINLASRCKSIQELTIHIPIFSSDFKEIFSLLEETYIFSQLTVLNIFYCNHSNDVVSLKYDKPKINIAFYRCIRHNIF